MGLIFPELLQGLLTLSSTGCNFFHSYQGNRKKNPLNMPLLTQILMLKAFNCSFVSTESNRNEYILTVSDDTNSEYYLLRCTSSRMGFSKTTGKLCASWLRALRSDSSASWCVSLVAPVHWHVHIGSLYNASRFS